MNAALFGILAYVVLQLVIGWAASRRIKTEADYLLAGRSLGYWLATFSIFATWFGAESCMGAAGAAYEHGLVGGRTDPLGYALCMVLLGALLARELYKRKLVTVLDFVRARFSPAVERAGALVLIPTSLMWAGAQIRALGQVFSTSSAMELQVAMTIAAGVVIFYTVLGGLMADVVTDLIQGAILIASIALVFFLIVYDSGGIGPLFERIPKDRLTLRPPGESMVATLDTWAVPIFGSLISQELISRVNASKSSKVATRSCYLAAGIYLIVGCVPLLIGLLGPSLLPGLTDPEQLLPTLAKERLGGLLYIVFAGALVSAILSTVDSALLSVSALFSKNVLQSVHHDMSEAQKVRSARLFVILGGLVAYAIALSSDSIHELVVEASSLGGGGFLVLVIFGLFTKWGGTPSAVGALVLGTIVWGTGTFLLEMEGTFLAAVAAGTVGYLALLRLGQPADPPEDADPAAVRP